MILAQSTMSKPDSFPDMPLWGWTFLGAAFTAVRAYRDYRSRNPSTAWAKARTEFFIASIGGLPVSWVACEICYQQFPWVRSWHSILPLLAATSGSVGHRVFVEFGGRLVTASSRLSKRALDAVPEHKDKDKDP